MKKNRRIIAYLSIGIISLITTIAVYALTRGDEVVTSEKLGLGFLLFAIIFVTMALIFMEIAGKNISHIMFRTGFYGVISFYALISIISSIVYINSKSEQIVAFLCLQIISFAILAITIIMIFVTSISVSQNERKAEVSYIRVDKMMGSLAMLKKDDRYNKKIEELIEKLKYCDVSSGAEVDSDIEAKISELGNKLSSDNEEDIYAILNDIARLIDVRKEQVRSKKIGKM